MRNTKILTCVKRWDDFPFAHRQPKHTGHCALIHGHNWSFEFEFIARDKDECGFVIDFGGLKDLKVWLDRMFDHTLVLNLDDPLLEKMMELEKANPHREGPAWFDITRIPDCSCEGIAEFLLVEANKHVDELTKGRVAVYRVTVYEDSKNSATVKAINIC